MIIDKYTYLNYNMLLAGSYE